MCVGCSLGLFLGGVLSIFIFTFRISTEICSDLVKGCIGKVDSYCTCSQCPMTHLRHSQFGASWGSLSSGNSTLTVICCSCILKSQVLFRLCTGIRREQKREQQKWFQACLSLIEGLLFLWGRARLPTSPSTLLHTSPCLGKANLSLTIRHQFPQVLPGRTRTCSPTPAKPLAST